MRLIFVDNWNLIGPELESKGSPLISRWFLVIVVFVGNRIVTNVLVGLMIESVSSVNDDYMKEKREKKILRNQKKREELSKRRRSRVLATLLICGPLDRYDRSLEHPIVG